MAYALIQSDSPSRFIDLAEFDEEISAALQAPGEEELKTIAVPHVVRQMIIGFKAMGLLNKMVDRTRDPKGDQLALARTKLRDDLLRMARRYGVNLSGGYDKSLEFCQNPDIDFNNLELGQYPATLANFDATTREIQRVTGIADEIYHEVRSVAGSEADFDFGSAVDVAEQYLSEAYQVGPVRDELVQIRDDIYGDSAVRLAIKTRTHLENSRAVQNGAYVLETPTVLDLLNSIHSKVYGRKTSDAIGVALGGAPGLGKTAILSHYIKSVVGVDPVSIDIDPGQSAFTLMAKPSLLESDPIAATLATIEQLKGMEEHTLKGILSLAGAEFMHSIGLTDLNELPDKDVLIAKMRQGLDRIVERQMALALVSAEKRGPYVYGPIFDALEKNVPIIINEVQHLRQADFLHSLLTAIPATDEEAGPMPSWIPEEGEANYKQPKGWFFSTMTGRWMRVPHRFRVFFTGNIGQEFGNAGLPPALVSRLADRFQEMPMLPTEEQVEIAWAWSSNRDGLSNLSKDNAVKLYHLLTVVVPEIERLHNSKNIRGKKSYFSIRTIIAIAKALNPEGKFSANRKPVDLETAIYEQFIQPTIANKHFNSLEIVVAVLFAAGYITTQTLDKITVDVPQFEIGKIRGMYQQLAGGNGAAAKNVKFDLKANSGSYEESCVVCGVDCCPAHTEVIEEHIDDIQLQLNLMNMQLDESTIKKVLELQRKWIANGQWEYLLNYQTASIGGFTRLAPFLTKEKQEALLDYIKTLVEAVLFTDETYSPTRCIKEFQTLQAISSLGLAKDVLDKNRGRIQAYLDNFAEHHFASHTNLQYVKVKDKEEPQAKAAKELNANQVMALRLCDMAKSEGYDVSLSKYEALASGVRVTLARSKSELVRARQIGKDRKKNPFEYIKLIATSTRLFTEDERMQQYLEEKHLDLETSEMIVNLILARLDSSSAITWSTGIDLTPPVRKGRGSEKRIFRGEPAKLPIEAEKLALLDELQLRSEVLEVISEWRTTITNPSLISFFEEHSTVILTAQKAWLEEHRSRLTNNEQAVLYLQHVEKLSKIFGIELQSTIDRVLEPKKFKAPPMREF